MSCLQGNGARFDIGYQTYGDTDTLSIYFTKPKQGLIADTDHISAGIVADYADNGRLVSLDIRAATRKTPCHSPCHLFNTAEVLDGKQPLALNWFYERNRLAVFLSNWDLDICTDVVQTDDSNITLGMDATGQLCAVFVEDPVTNTFPERDCD